MPAIKRRPVDSPVTKQYTINDILGGTITPIVHDASVMEAANAGW